jgi:hypothetical protein
MKTFNYTAAEYEADENVQEYARELVYNYLYKYCTIEKPVLAVFSDYIDPDDDNSLAQAEDLECVLFDAYFNDDIDWGYETIYEKLFSESDMDEDEVAAIWDEAVTVLEDNGFLNIDHLVDEYEFCEFAFNKDDLDDLSVSIPEDIWSDAIKAFKRG